jgi:hypothetical protein
MANQSFPLIWSHSHPWRPDKRHRAIRNDRMLLSSLHDNRLHPRRTMVLVRSQGRTSRYSGYEDTRKRGEESHIDDGNITFISAAACLQFTIANQSSPYCNDGTISSFLSRTCSASKCLGITIVDIPHVGRPVASQS